jgi:hypothetical protein
MSARRVVLLALALLLVPPAAAAADAPGNDDRDSASRVPRLPATVGGTLRGAGVEGVEAPSPCAATSGSVWYRLDAGVSRRVVVRLAAAGDLDATIDVYARQRSQQQFLTCDVGDLHGRAAVAFDVWRGSSYLIRVARRANSVSDAFELAFVGVAARPPLPGPPLPETGVSGTLDRAQRTAQAWAATLREGVRYRIGLDHPGSGCVSAFVYGPRPRSGMRPAARVRCKGYLLFTPRAGRGGRYAIVVHADASARGNQRYHLQLARATADDTAPGVFVPNYARVRDSLDGRGVDQVDLYRFDVTRRSVLFLHLRTPGAFDLVLLDAWGDVIRCECDGRGGQSLHKGLHPGRFFVAIRSRDRSSARYTLLRASRTITTSRLRANGAGSAAVAPGMAATITVLTHPPVDGPVTVTFEQFDPLAGWQFVRALRATAHAGIATVHWTAPTVGRWRATATYNGTRAVAPSDTGFVKLLVAGPLRD